MDIDQETRDRFYEYIVKTPACWLWKVIQPIYYGSFTYGEQTYPAHRFSYMIHKGAIPPGLIVRHTCDVPSCVNPDHLLVGTFADNSHDAVIRGRLIRRTDERRYKTYLWVDPSGRPYAVVNVRLVNGKYKQIRKRISAAADAPRVAKLLADQWKERNPEQVAQRRTYDY